MIKHFQRLYDAGRVSRYHAADMHGTQSLAQHSWGVAMITAVIAPSASANLLKAALLHDLAESFTGDVPSQFKWVNDSIRLVLKDAEVLFHKETDSEVQLDSHEQEILKWADAFEGLLWAQHEVRLGNQYAREVRERYKNWLMGRRWPTPEAYDLWQIIMGDNHA